MQLMQQTNATIRHIVSAIVPRKRQHGRKLQCFKSVNCSNDSSGLHYTQELTTEYNYFQTNDLTHAKVARPQFFLHCLTPRLDPEKPSGEDSCSNPANHHLSQESSCYYMITLHSCLAENHKIHAVQWEIAFNTFLV